MIMIDMTREQRDVFLTDFAAVSLRNKQLFNFSFSNFVFHDATQRRSIWSARFTINLQRIVRDVTFTAMFAVSWFKTRFIDLNVGRAGNFGFPALSV